MKPHTLLSVLLGVMLLTTVLILPYVPSSAVREPLRAARNAQAAQDYEGAVQHLESVLSVQAAPGVLHNLGNAQYHLGRLGKSILAWERARSLDPGLQITTGNLHFARGQAGIEAPVLGWTEKYSLLLASDAWIWLATAAVWVSIGALSWPRLMNQRRSSWSQGTAVLAIGTLLLVLPALFGIASRAHLGVIVEAETPVRLTPTKEGETIGKLREGEMARQEKVRGEYVYIRADLDRAGWVRRTEFERLWP